jgi:hypothetical protein
MRALALLLLLAGCAPVADTAPGRDPVALELAGRIAAPAKRCIPAERQQPIRIADPRTLIYRRGDTLWVNRQERDCFGNQVLASLIVETSGSSYCNGDRVRRLDSGSSIPGPTCLLRNRVPYRRPS